ncbi:thiol:disulfide interchange protein DsbD [mine drainage metagenome]|uniref:Thiol:disulfide interchange protein DsbD n=1 Tax=mine drainage metagenome TaxID=410659 RepID=A0A1J5PQN7_9ZZZZ
MTGRTVVPFMNTLLRFLTFFVLAVLPWFAVAQDLPTRFDPRRDAAKDLMTAQKLARTENKRVLVDVGGQWCSWCRMFDRLVDSQSQIRAELERHYVWVKINYSTENKNLAVLSKWPMIHGYPYLLVLDGAGKVLHAQGVQGLEIETDKEADENYDPARVMALLSRYATAANVPVQNP